MNEGIRRWALPGVIAGLVVALLVVALTREPAQFDAGTPEGVVQRYLQAISDGSFETAFDYLDSELYKDCDATDLARHTPVEPFGATLGTSTWNGDSAFVEVTIQFGVTENPLEPRSASYESFLLTRSDGAWMISGKVWPYFAWECGENF